MDVRAETVRFFEMGFANKAAGRLPGIPQATVIKWLYTYRALGKEALFVPSIEPILMRSKSKQPRP
ncbi:hypothetical protein D1643_07670 [Enterorhabdus sp. P55]|nr:hypothetical protein [Enterorhabdus sp. P55]